MIHPTSVIETGAVVAPHVQIGPFCHIGAGVTIGAGVRIEANVILEGPVTIEQNVRIFSFAKIGNGVAPVTVGAGTHLREFCQIASQNSDADPVTVASGNFIMAYVQLFPGVSLGENCVLTNAVTMQNNSGCEERVIIGGLSTIHATCRIGTGVMVGGASSVRFDLPPFCLVEGNPASVKGLNIIGLRRRFENREDIDSVKESFKKLYRTFDPKAAAAMADTLQNPQAKRFAAFIAAHRCGPAH